MTPKCDICGEAATQFARDVYRTERPTGPRYSPVPHVKCGCDDHPPESCVIELHIEDAEDPARVLIRNEFDQAWQGWRT